MAGRVKPLPRPDGVSGTYWKEAGARRLSMPRCVRCARFTFPPLPRCRYCLSDELAWTQLRGTGAIHSWCVVHTDLVGGFEPPYAVVEVRLDEQDDLLMVSNLPGTALDAIRIGARVEVCFEQRTAEIALPQFRVVP